MGLIGLDERLDAQEKVTPMEDRRTPEVACKKDRRRPCDQSSPQKDFAVQQHRRHQRSLELNKTLALLKEDIKRMNDYQPKIRNLLDVDVQDPQKICALRRNQSIKNLRCLNTFYGFQAKTFTLSANLLDRFATKVKVQPRYLPCAAAACFLLAASECEDPSAVPPVAQLLRVSQCDCTPGDVARMQAVVLSKVPACSAAVITPLTIIERLITAFATWFGSGGTGDVVFDDVAALRMATSKLCSIVCQAELLVAKPTVIGLSVLHYCLEELGLHSHDSVINLFVMLQDVCDVGDAEFRHYYDSLSCYLCRCDEPATVTAGPRQWPRADMRWTISRRTMAQLRPSCSAVSDLPVIHETPFDESASSQPVAGTAMAVPFCCSSDVMVDMSADVSASPRSWAAVVAATSPPNSPVRCIGTRCYATALPAGGGAAGALSTCSRS